MFNWRIFYCKQLHYVIISINRWLYFLKRKNSIPKQSQTRRRFSMRNSHSASNPRESKMTHSKTNSFRSPFTRTWKTSTKQKTKSRRTCSKDSCRSTIGTWVWWSWERSRPDRCEVVTETRWAIEGPSGLWRTSWRSRVLTRWFPVKRKALLMSGGPLKRFPVGW